ncbi:myb-like protein X isoform X2 [Mytilus trossulus]|uniref:myb-like protein X isoform X2 n=1 Tax=Mytilus trossulus TaxID=6551 RepID=UPI0030055464
MATVSSFRWLFIILQITCSAGSTTKSSTVQSTTETSTSKKVLDAIISFFKSDSIMYFSAGFMTAALIFSIGCFVSKCKTSRRKNDDAENAELVDDEDQVFASAHENEYVNEGSFESDQKSYAYCHIDTDQKSSDDFSQSSTSKKRYNRESYDLVDHNRIKSSLLNEKENPNPYNHVTIDMEVTEYDNASFLKPRIEIIDPTYSHLSDVKLQDENPSLTTKKDDKGKKEHRSMDEKNNSSNKKNKKQKTTEKEKQKKTERKKENKQEKVKEKGNQKQTKLENETQKLKKPETEKQKKKQKNPEKDKGKQVNQQKETHKPKTQENEALKQKETKSEEKMKIKQEQRTDIIQIAMDTGEYKVINNCENDGKKEKTIENDNENENPSEDNKLNRHKFGYSLVQKQRSIPNEEIAHTIEGSQTFEILCDQDDSSYQLTSSSEESNETSEVSTGSNSRKSSVPGVSDETSGSGSETETDNLLPPAMAINILYEDVSVSEGNVLIGPIAETSESEFESQKEDGNN